MISAWPCAHFWPSSIATCLDASEHRQSCPQVFATQYVVASPCDTGTMWRYTPPCDTDVVGGMATVWHSTTLIYHSPALFKPTSHHKSLRFAFVDFAPNMWYVILLFVGWGWSETDVRGETHVARLSCQPLQPGLSETMWKNVKQCGISETMWIWNNVEQCETMWYIWNNVDGGRQRGSMKGMWWLSSCGPGSKCRYCIWLVQNIQFANSFSRILALSSHSVVRPQASHPTLSRLYDLVDHTNQIISESLWHLLSTTDPPTTQPLLFLTHQ